MRFLGSCSTKEVTFLTYIVFISVTRLLSYCSPVV
jgi:hypothetical protein